MDGSAIKAALASTLVLCAAIYCAPARCQDPFNDNQTWAAQPPGAFLNNKPAAKKTVATQAVKKTASKPAPLKPNVQSQPTLSRAGGNQSSAQYPAPNQQQSNQQMGQSDWQQMGNAGNSSNTQMGTSDWVAPTNDGFNDESTQSSNQDSQDNGQGWVTNTNQNSGQNFNQGSGSSGQIGQSGWNNPGQSSQNSMQSVMPNQGSGGGIGQSEWVSPGGGNNNSGNTNSGNNNSGNNSGGQSRPSGAFSNQFNQVNQSNQSSPNQTPGFPPIQQSSNGIGQSGWTTPGGGDTSVSNNGGNSFNNNNSNQPPPFPQSSFQQSGSTGGNFGSSTGNSGSGAPSFGAVLEQEQLQGGAQINASGSGMGNMNGGGNGGMGSGGGMGMPAFNQSAAAGVLPGIMNFMQNVMPQKGNTFNPNTMNSGGGTITGGTGAVFVPQQQVQKRPSQPMHTPVIVKQVGRQVNRTVNRAVNRSVNQMLFRGVNSLRF